jgi:hypothetical protein
MALPVLVEMAVSSLFIRTGRWRCVLWSGSVLDGVLFSLRHGVQVVVRSKTIGNHHVQRSVNG